MRSEAPTVDAYLDDLDDARREALATLREIIRVEAPDAEELMKYGHPHYELNGPLFALASQKHHMALYVAEKATLAEWRHLGERRGVEAAKSCLRFRRLERLALDDIRSLIAEAASARRAKGGSADP